MIKAADGKIGTREFASIILLTIGIKFSDTTPGILFEKGKNAAWMMPLLSFIVICVTLLILLTLLKKHNMGLVELIIKLTGKYVGGLIVLLLFLFIFIGTFINARSYSDIVDTMFYPNTPVPFVLILLLAVSFFIAKRGLEAIARTAWLIIPAAEFSVILLLIFVWQDLHWEHLFPIAGPGFKELVKESFTHSAIYGEAIMFAVLFSFSRSYKVFRTASLIGIGASCLKMTIYLAVYVMMFDFPSVQNMAYPYQQLTRIASVGQAFSHIEGVFLAIWLLVTVVHFAIYFYLSAYLFAGTLNIKDFEPLILPLAGLALFLALIPENIFQIIQYREWLLKSSSWSSITLPVFLWIIDRWKGRKRRGST